MMALMDRIKVLSFLSRSLDEKREFISALQGLRTNELEIARTRAGRVTATAKKNLAKRGKAPKDPEAELLRLLAKNPHMINQLEKLIH